MRRTDFFITDAIECTPKNISSQPLTIGESQSGTKAKGPGATISAGFPSFGQSSFCISACIETGQALEKIGCNPCGCQIGYHLRVQPARVSFGKPCDRAGRSSFRDVLVSARSKQQSKKRIQPTHFGSLGCPRYRGNRTFVLREKLVRTAGLEPARPKGDRF